MVDKYGFAYQKNQYRWIHPRNKKLPIAGSDWVAAPATLAEFRRCWVSSRHFFLVINFLSIILSHAIDYIILLSDKYAL